MPEDISIDCELFFLCKVSHGKHWINFHSCYFFLILLIKLIYILYLFSIFFVFLSFYFWQSQKNTWTLVSRLIFNSIFLYVWANYVQKELLHKMAIYPTFTVKREILQRKNGGQISQWSRVFKCYRLENYIYNNLTLCNTWYVRRCNVKKKKKKSAAGFYDRATIFVRFLYVAKTGSIIDVTKCRMRGIYNCNRRSCEEINLFISIS